MSRIIKMVDEIKEYYNLNDTLLASDLGIMQQTIKGWREGRKPNLDNYNKVKKMYEEMKQEAVDESIVQRFEALEDKVEKKPYEVEVPEDIENYYYVDEIGEIYIVGSTISSVAYKDIYQCGLAFKTRKEVGKFDKERILLFKLHKWAEERNGERTHNWNETSEVKYCVEYNNYTGRFLVDCYSAIFTFSKLPYFKSEKIAEQFIEEFGDEIIEVLC